MQPATDTREAASHFMDWLRDAHAMEEQAESMLDGMAGRLESYPDLRQRILEHLEETRDQRRLIKECIDRRGGDNSMMKDLTGKAMASMQSFSGMFASDEVVKGGMFSYAFEHMEIAAYRNLIEAARMLGDTATQQVCERILPQEIAMAAWLEQNMAAVTRRFLERADQPGAQAKR
ncbi:ferritin-like domain-containing protein [Bordetella genomosp. 13]|uniref:ferritin-like domain-containing protein n=1 Tax=Bordetella genomosp. 13 TaxID=463040 RepID=UPI0021B64049|nr:ferritin-like domain-containing protein [Bordetella genomosp. 13]